MGMELNEEAIFLCEDSVYRVPKRNYGWSRTERLQFSRQHKSMRPAKGPRDQLFDRRRCPA